ncbi:MAG: peptidase S16 [Rhodospirillales bacterium]|nr:peptidase S16 [Rhodospirillales bacterium]
MTHSPLRPDDLPETIPVFPLAGALLLPHGRLPLNIFEPRYLAMVEDALAAGRVLGMMQGDASRPRGEHGTAIYSVGCLGRITSFSETEDGRFLIALSGIMRFRVLEEEEMRRGYRRMRVDYNPYHDDLDALPANESMPREDFLAVLQPYFQHQGMDVNWEAIEKTPEAMLVTTLSMLCPFAVAEKQALLEAPLPADRTKMMLALMQMAMHGGDAEAGSRPS